MPATHWAKMSVFERFWSLVRKRSSGCWEWNGYVEKGGNGHARFKFKGKRDGAHRWSYEFAIGPVPAGLWVLHHCDNGKCVRPSHLYTGTRDDNTKDAVRRGRTARGEKHGMSKLTQEEARQIRKLYATGKYTQRQLAKKFNVTQCPIARIVNHKGWRG